MIYFQYRDLPIALSLQLNNYVSKEYDSSLAFANLNTAKSCPNICRLS